MIATQRKLSLRTSRTNTRTSSRNGATQYPHFDALGSTRQLSDIIETITDTWLYDAWGDVLSHAGVTVFPLQFVGRFGYFFDLDTNTFYIIRRIYEPKSGRWLSVDSLWPYSSLNHFAYADNHPVIYIDATGDRSCNPDKECLHGKAVPSDASGGRCVVDEVAVLPAGARLNPGDLKSAEDAIGRLGWISRIYDMFSGAALGKPNPASGVSALWGSVTDKVPTLMIHRSLMVAGKTQGVNIHMLMREEQCKWVECGCWFCKKDHFTLEYSTSKAKWTQCMAQDAPSNLLNTNPPTFQQGTITKKDITACFCEAVKDQCPNSKLFFQGGGDCI